MCSIEHWNLKISKLSIFSFLLIKINILDRPLKTLSSCGSKPISLFKVWTVCSSYWRPVIVSSACLSSSLHFLAQFSFFKIVNFESFSLTCFFLMFSVLNLTGKSIPASSNPHFFPHHYRYCFEVSFINWLLQYGSLLKLYTVWRFSKKFDSLMAISVR